MPRIRSGGETQHGYAPRGSWVRSISFDGDYELLRHANDPRSAVGPKGRRLDP